MNNNSSAGLKSKATTVDSRDFYPDQFLNSWHPASIPQNNDLRTAIVKSFRLKQTDDYVYHAIASVTLSQVQVAIDHGDVNGMHAWYRDVAGQQIPPPSQTDIEAYVQIFEPTTATTKALAAFAGNAKKDSLRTGIAKHLQDNFLPPAKGTGLVLPSKQKTPFTVNNPYLDFWAWSCLCLEWAGPNASTVNVKQSHHILPIFYHHFGCVCPTYDALSLIQQLARPAKKAKHDIQINRPIIDIGSGNGYWTCLLRRMSLTVYAVDNALSAWRTTWVPDTIQTDGIEFLRSKKSFQTPNKSTMTAASGIPGVGHGGKDAILLLVYPQISGGFTINVINAYKGDYIVVAGTQNENGFTGFVGETIAAWMVREKPQFEKVVQIPLPSFAGKDEALFVFVRRKGEAGGG